MKSSVSGDVMKMKQCNAYDPDDTLADLKQRVFIIIVYYYFVELEN